MNLKSHQWISFALQYRILYIIDTSLPDIFLEELSYTEISKFPLENRKSKASLALNYKVMFWHYKVMHSIMFGRCLKSRVEVSSYTHLFSYQSRPTLFLSQGRSYRLLLGKLPQFVYLRSGFVSLLKISSFHKNPRGRCF